MTEFSILYRKDSKYKKLFENKKKIILRLKKYQISLIFSAEDPMKCTPEMGYERVFIVDEKGNCMPKTPDYPVLERGKTEYTLDKETEIKSGDLIKIGEHEFWII